ncbi:MAG TPA: ATP-binding protein [Pseudolabrys sp.]|jgi:CheY-like chemotaxis protein
MAKHAKKRRRRARGKKAGLSKAPSPRAIEVALAGIAHDIRTPLTGIVALAELLASSDLGAREREWATAIKSGADHLSALTTVIVDAAKAEAKGLVLRDEPFSPRALAEAIGAALAARAHNKGLKTEIDTDNNLPPLVLGDSLRLRAALENLADNAVKFTHEGKVAFRAAAEPAPRGRVRLVFTFADNGIGIAASELNQLFRPFAQASARISKQYGGAGLGLSFVKRFAKAMGGDLQVTSKMGSGSTFRLSALVGSAQVQEAVTRRDARPVSIRPLSILCAEDNPYGRVVMNTILGELGHHVDFAETGEAAVAAVERGGYDVVLMDVTLGGMSGLEAARRIRALPGKPAETPIIGVSGRSETGDEAAARAAGMNFYFVKPVSPRKLAQALAECSKV